MRSRDRAGVVLLDGDSIVLIERQREGMHYFVCPGGGVEPGETFEQAAIREAKEELGVDVELDSIALEVEFRGRQIYFFGHIRAGTVRETYFDEEKLLGLYRPIWLPVDALGSIDVRPPELIVAVSDSVTRRWSTEPEA